MVERSRVLLPSMVPRLVAKSVTVAAPLFFTMKTRPVLALAAMSVTVNGVLA